VVLFITQILTWQVYPHVYGSICSRIVGNIYIVTNVDRTKPIAISTTVTKQLLMNHTKQYFLRHQELYMFSIYSVLQEAVCDQVSSSLFTK